MKRLPLGINLLNSLLTTIFQLQQFNVFGACLDHDLKAPENWPILLGLHVTGVELLTHTANDFLFLFICKLSLIWTYAYYFPL